MNPTEPKFSVGDVVQAKNSHTYIPRAVVIERKWGEWFSIFDGRKIMYWCYSLSECPLGDIWWPQCALRPIPDASTESWEEMRERLKADAGVVA